ncbi:DinB family protein [Flagellimonas myxillae]|uniref:DinB family protein n=1 Tax=Flagellimonas myxillae TaxID=2942214 RepID=UPI00201F2D2F|nr:DinB family protein [Muricauda myxillae]MCL6267987.1 DinB family protein [Muricauda myxillae]
MRIASIINGLEANGGVFRETLTGFPSDMLLWKSDPKGWCLLEIICHLVDEEKFDFRMRVKHALETPTEPLIPFDPIGLMTKHKYLEQDFDRSLQEFLEERKQSIAWLQSLDSPNWDSALDHPSLGRITAASFLYNWLAHDYHHIRQINNLKHAYLKLNSGDSLTYAGKW